MSGVCPKHNEPLTKVGKTWYCPTCLHHAHITHETQKEAQRRWRESERGKQKVREWEKGPGKETRNRYLKGPKYKACRKTYNWLLGKRIKMEQQKLELAGRTVRRERPRKAEIVLTPKLREQQFAALQRDIATQIVMGPKPTFRWVLDVAKTYESVQLTPDQARELLDQVTKNVGGKQ